MERQAMRHYQRLDSVTYDETNDTLLIGCEGGECLPNLWFGREGLYVSISASYGPLEISLRPRQQDLTNSLAQLKPTDRLAVMRLVGTGQAHLELGLSQTGELLVRAVIVADATGHFAMNLILTPAVSQHLYKWMGIQYKVAV
jgi:hypothetical protein